MKLSTLLLAIFAPLAVLVAAAPEAEAEAAPAAAALPAALAEPVAEAIAEPVAEAEPEPAAAAHDKRWPPPPAKDCLKSCRPRGYKCPKGYVRPPFFFLAPSAANPSLTIGGRRRYVLQLN